MSVSITDFDLRNAFQTERTLLSLSGFYPRRQKTAHDWLYILSALFNLFFSYVELFSIIAQMVLEKNDLPKVSDALLFFMTHLTFLCKLTNFGYYRDQLLELEDLLEKPIFYSFNKEQLNTLSKKIDGCKLVAKIFRFLCVMCILMYGLIPYFGGDKKLPLPGWLPYDVSRHFHETVVFQMISASVSAYNNSTIDILTWKLITIASGQFEILVEKLEDVVYKRDGDEAEAEAYFKSCVGHQAAVVGYVGMIEATFSKGIFLQFLASIGVICFTGFQMLVVPYGNVQFLFLLMYFSCMMCQVAMYCWYGHDVMVTSSEIGRSCYMSDWYESNLQMRTSIIIFLEMTKKPIIVTAGKFVALSLTTLTSILRSSYSYFAVLRQMYADA